MMTPHAKVQNNLVLQRPIYKGCPSLAPEMLTVARNTWQPVRPSAKFRAQRLVPPASVSMHLQSHTAHARATRHHSPTRQRAAEHMARRIERFVTDSPLAATGAALLYPSARAPAAPVAMRAPSPPRPPQTCCCRRRRPPPQPFRAPSRSSPCSPPSPTSQPPPRSPSPTNSSSPTRSTTPGRCFPSSPSASLSSSPSSSCAAASRRCRSPCCARFSSRACSSPATSSPMPGPCAPSPCPSCPS